MLQTEGPLPWDRERRASEESKRKSFRSLEKVGDDPRVIVRRSRAKEKSLLLPQLVLVLEGLKRRSEPQKERRSCGATRYPTEQGTNWQIQEKVRGKLDLEFRQGSPRCSVSSSRPIMELESSASYRRQRISSTSLFLFLFVLAVFSSSYLSFAQEKEPFLLGPGPFVAWREFPFASKTDSIFGLRLQIFWIALTCRERTPWIFTTFWTRMANEVSGEGKKERESWRISLDALAYQVKRELEVSLKSTDDLHTSVTSRRKNQKRVENN